MSEKQSQREFAVEVVHTIREARHQALWAGGCVRDQLLGIEPKDYDVATSARPEQIRELFGKRRTLAIGAAFGVITVLGRKSHDPIEVATFRSDGEYLDGRHPTSITYSDAEHDAQRRDFTINGLFFDPLAETTIDYVGGKADLEAGIIRAIRDPRERFTEDKLRMLRAVRFAATFNFEIESETLQAVREMAPEVGSVSAERIGMELRRMLVHQRRALALKLLVETGLLKQVLPSLAVYQSEALAETGKVLERLDDPSLALALATLLWQLNDPTQVTAVARSLRYTNREGERATWLLENLRQLAQAELAPWPRIQRLLIHPGAGELIELHEAIAGGEDSSSAFCRGKLALPEEELNPSPLVVGADLIAHGVKPGPEFAVLLARIRDAQLDGKVTDKAHALGLVDEWRNEE